MIFLTLIYILYFCNMNRIEEVIKEHGYTVTSLAEKIGTSKQNLFAKLKSPSYPTLVEIATALDVPMWQLFASPAEVTGSRDFVAIVRYNGELKEVTSVGELERIVSELKGEETEPKPIGHKNIRGKEYFEK